MVLDTRLVAFPFSSESVWNTGLSATGTAGGRSLSAGFESDWAQGLDILGYVSNARLEYGAHQGAVPAVSLAPCIVVGTPIDVTIARELANAAGRDSVVARLPGARLRVTPDVRLVADRTE